MPAAPDRAGRPRSAARVLAWFWGPVLLVVAAGAAVLQVLGPPAPVKSGTPVIAVFRPAAPAAPETAPAPSLPNAALPNAALPNVALAPAPAAPTETAMASAAASPPAAGAAIAAPDKALLEPANDYPGAMLPRVGADGRAPMRVYAAGFDASDRRPRIALLLAGMGMSDAASENAVAMTPAAVSLAVSPYANQPQALLEAARARGHELLIGIPLEPQNYPVNDAGDHALLTADAPQANALRLEWTLSRIAGYVGATGAIGLLHGERYEADTQMNAVMRELAKRGLIYIDPRPASAAAVPGPPPSRSVDLVVDEPPMAAAVDAKLAQLEQIAHDRGTALGLVDMPTPVAVSRIAAWANTLGQRGYALVPVTALLPVWGQK